ncbi:hypothetical protein KSF_011500 [Reticulibacter mediterranei]|uniref:Ester cyclase n=1 Tax=Reticulibacter mediterranei TaxID=2778369 RepID=A0A8J3MYR0_9CHLR|nr:ester cyclase [Reticulibacter mediterranei]GHO91102.1 hypothetical protein KSF_011500 [Reticulibacter mediterranei]
MSAQDNVKLIEAIVDGFNTRDYGPFIAAAADSIEVRDLPRNVTQHGPAGFRQFTEDLHVAFPDSKITVTNLQATDQQVTLEFSCTGTQTGAFGFFPATNKNISMHFVNIYEISNGKIVKVRTYYDGLTFIRQLGLRLS